MSNTFSAGSGINQNLSIIKEVSGKFSLMTAPSKEAVRRAAQVATSYTETFEGAPELTVAASNYNQAGLKTIIADLANTGGVINVRNGMHLRKSLGVTSSRILFQAAGENEPWTWHPDTANDVLFQWFYRRYTGEDGLTGSYVVSPLANTEGQLEGCGARGVTVLGNRVTRGNVWRMVGTDHGFFQDCQVRGVAGFAMDAQHVREFCMSNFITRFNGWVDPANPTNGVANMYLAGSYMPDNYGSNREKSNLNTWENIQLTFSFFHELVVDGAFYNSFNGFLVHQLARANLSLEDIIIKQFPELCVGTGNAARGWDSSGNPKNPYAALHAGAPNVTGTNNANGDAARLWGRGFAAANAILNKSTSRLLRIDNGRIVGGGTTQTIVNTDNSTMTIGQVDASSASPSEWTVSMDNVSNGLFTAVFYAGGLSVLPETGTTVVISSLSASPLPFLQGATMYLIRVSDLTFRIANSYQNALDGVAMTFTATGNNLRMRMGGELFVCLKDSELVMSGLGEFSQGRILAYCDPTSLITERKIATSLWSEGPSIPSGRNLVKLGEVRGINLKTAGDYLLKKTCVGNRLVPTSIVVDRISGGLQANAAIAALFTGAGGTGVQIGTHFSLNGLIERDQNQQFTINPTVSVVFTVTNGGSGAAATATVDVNGVVTALTITNGGTGYTGAPDVYIKGTKAKAIATVAGGVVTALTLSTTGYGYSSAPTVTVIGAGSGAVITATTNGDAITGFTITNGGTGYTTAPSLLITGGGGKGAVAVATVSGGVITAVTMGASGGGWVYSARQMDDHIVSPAVTPVAPWYFRLTTASANDTYVNAHIYGYILD